MLKSGSDHEGLNSEVPQNLRRKVVAKRPFLGHVVPKNGQKSGGMFLLHDFIINPIQKGSSDVLNYT